MEFTFSEAEEQFRKELREWIKNELIIARMENIRSRLKIDKTK